MEKIPEHCFAITLTNHSVQAQIRFTNARSQFQPDWASSGACSVHNAYMYVQNYIYRYNMVCDIKCTYATQTLHVRYVQFSGKVGDGVQLWIPYSQHYSSQTQNPVWSSCSSTALCCMFWCTPCFKFPVFFFLQMWPSSFLQYSSLGVSSWAALIITTKFFQRQPGMCVGRGDSGVHSYENWSTTNLKSLHTLHVRH